MQHQTFASRLRYLAAADVDDTVVDYDGLAVVGADGDGLGEVDGFIVDAQATRLLYMVVDSGGWFRSRRVLIPVGHATLSPDRAALRLDVTRSALSRYPEFDEDRFRDLSDEDMKIFEQQIADACCPDDPAPDRGSLRHYAQPDWWTSSPYAHERLRPVDTSAYASVPAPPAREYQAGESIRGGAHDDVSPHADGRAQPGDVIGIETGGERTGVGDTAEDENRRRRVAQRAVGYDDEEPRRSDR